MLLKDEERSSLGGEELQRVAETNVQSMALLASAQGVEGAMSRLEEARSVLSAPFTRNRYDALFKHTAISHHILRTSSSYFKAVACIPDHPSDLLGSLVAVPQVGTGR